MDRAETTQVRKTGIEGEQGRMEATIGFYLSGVIAIAIIFIGCRFLLVPSTAAAAYGVPAGAEPHLRAYLSAKGIRDIASGLFAAILIAYGSAHVLTVAFGVHGGTAVAMLIISGLLLID